MKIAISSKGPDLDSEVERRFGRSPYYIIYDTETGNFEALSNPAASAPGGAGIQAAQFIAQKGAQYILTGDVGPNAYPALMAAGIMIITGVTGRVKDAIESFKKGELGAAQAGFPGVGAPPGMGFPGAYPQSQPFKDPHSEIQALKNHLERLKEQIDALLKRLDEIERGETK